MCEMQFMSKTQQKTHQECPIWLEIIGLVYVNDKQHKLGEITTTENIKQAYAPFMLRLNSFVRVYLTDCHEIV